VTFTQIRLRKLVNRVSHRWHVSHPLNTPNDSLNLQLRIMLRVPSDEVSDSPQVISTLLRPDNLHPGRTNSLTIEAWSCCLPASKSAKPASTFCLTKISYIKSSQLADSGKSLTSRAAADLIDLEALFLSGMVVLNLNPKQPASPSSSSLSLNSNAIIQPQLAPAPDLA